MAKVRNLINPCKFCFAQPDACSFMQAGHTYDSTNSALSFSQKPQDVVTEVPAAKELFDKASDILSYDLLKVCTEGEGKSHQGILNHLMISHCWRDANVLP